MDRAWNEHGLQDRREQTTQFSFADFMEVPKSAALTKADSHDFQILKRDNKFADFVRSLDINDPTLTMSYKKSGTSVGFKVMVNGKDHAYFLPKNSATDPEAQVVSYKLGQYLHTEELVVPSDYFLVTGGALARFKRDLESARETNRWRRENRDKTLTAIRRNPEGLSGVIEQPHPGVAEIAGLADVKANRMNALHPLAKFIKADGPMPSARTEMTLKGMSTKAGEPPVNTQLQLSRELSQLMVIDALCGQWDRFSGGNLEARTDQLNRLHVFARDNGGATMTGKHHLERTLSMVSRFDRQQIARVEELVKELSGPDADNLSRRLGLRSDPSFLKQRAEAVLGHVRKNAVKYGENRVFFSSD